TWGDSISGCACDRRCQLEQDSRGARQYSVEGRATLPLRQYLAGVLSTRNGLEPRRRLVLRFKAVRVTVDQAPLAVLAAKDVRDAIPPLRSARDIRDRLVGVSLDIGHEEHVLRHDGRDVLMADAAALELPSGPVPTLLH